jgi:WD40 repeat protein
MRQIRVILWVVIALVVGCQGCSRPAPSLCQEKKQITQSALAYLALSQDGTLLATGSLDEDLVIYDVNSGKPVKTMPGRGRFGRAIFRGNSLLAYAGGEGVEVWDIRSWDHQSFPVDNDILSVTFDREGTKLCCGTKSGQLIVWNFIKRDVTVIPDAHIGCIWAVAASPVGNEVASAGDDQWVKIWDLDNAKVVIQCRDIDKVSHICYSSDGELVASGNDSGGITTWLRTTGAKLGTFPGHRGLITGMDFLPASKLLISTGTDRVVRLWDVGNNQEVAQLVLQRTSPVSNMAIALDGRLVAFRFQHGEVGIWELTKP